MKIIRLRAENYKRLTAIDITPDPDENVIEISGKNAQGKSSVLDAITDVLGEGNWGQEQPIRKGEKKSQVYLDLGDLRLTKTRTTSGPRLEVTNAEGMVFKTPQAVLDRIKGKYTFDPLEFSRQEAKKQKETLMSLVNPGIDLEAIARKKIEIYDERTQKNKELRQLEAEIKAIPEPEEDLPDNELSTHTIMEEIETSRQAEANIREKQGQLEDIAGRIKAKAERVEGLRSKIKEIEEQINKEIQLVETLGKAGKEAREELVHLPEPTDLEFIKDTLKTIEATNRKVRENQKRMALITKAHDKKSEADSLSSKLEQIDIENEEILRNLQYPIEGLGFNEIGVTYQGIPFSQIAESDHLKVSTAIAMALNPTLRIIMMRNASLLDSNSWKIVKELAQKENYQIWEEVVDETGKVGIYIEDGEVKKVNKPRKSKPTIV